MKIVKIVKNITYMWNGKKLYFKNGMHYCLNLQLADELVKKKYAELNNINSDKKNCKKHKGKLDSKILANFENKNKLDEEN